MVEVRVSLKEALLGFKLVLNHLDRHEVKIERENAVTAPGTVLKIAGEGLIRTDEDGAVTETGALLVTVWVDFPRSLNEEQTTLAKSLP